MKNGETRIVQRFLWLPLRLPHYSGGWYTGWFEWVKIEQQYFDKWYDARFVD